MGEYAERKLTIELIFEQDAVTEKDKAFLNSVYKQKYLSTNVYRKYMRISDKYLPELVIEEGYRKPTDLDPNEEVAKLCGYRNCKEADDKIIENIKLGNIDKKPNELCRWEEGEYVLCHWDFEKGKFICFCN
jgi:hypothetical protein